MISTMYRLTIVILLFFLFLHSAFGQPFLNQNIDKENMYWEKIITLPTPNNFERFITSILTGKNDQPDFKRGSEIQKILDSCAESSTKNSWIDI